MKTKTEYLQTNTYSIENSINHHAGNKKAGFYRYTIRRNEKFTITGLYHAETSDDDVSWSQFVLFNVYDLVWLLKMLKCEVFDESKDLLNLAEKLTGWTKKERNAGGKYRTKPIVEFVGLSKNWVKVSQCGEYDV